MAAPASHHHHHRRSHVRREVKWGVSAFLLVLVLEYLVLPQLGGFSKSLHQLDKVRVGYLLAGFVLEACALVAYAQLTRAVLPPGGPGRGRLLRIDLSTLALSHVIPGGTAGGAALSYRLITQEGVSGADTGFAIAMQGAGSAVVLNVLFWVALLISLFLRGYNPIYAVAAGAGVLLMATFAAVVVSLTRGHRRLVDLARRLAAGVPFVDGDHLADAISRFSGRLRAFAAQPSVLRRAVLWAAANWLFDAASLWVCLLAFHTVLSPVYLLVAYGLANILAVIPVTPGGLGIIEGVLVPTLVGFGVPNKSIALLAVLIYRFFNFWLPIPVGGSCYLSLRFSGEGWRQRLRHVREGATTPDDGSGEDTPEDRTPEGTPPQGTSPDRTPEGTPPEIRTPENPTPERRTPEGTSAEGTSPEGPAAPDGVRPSATGARARAGGGPAHGPTPGAPAAR